MTQRIQWLVCLAMLMFISNTCQAQAQANASDPVVTLRFVVTIPADTPEGDAIHLCGDDPRLGAWEGAGLKFEPQDDGTYQAVLLAEPGTHLQFKVTRGSWATVEKSETGDEIENRHVLADVDKQVNVVVASWAHGETQRVEPTLTGDIRRHDNFHSQILENDRTLLVYLPPGYDEEPQRLYPVLYMHDGQNIFDAATSFAGVEWQVDEAAERLIAAGKIEPIIIVGIYNNADRMTEYNPGDRDGQVTNYARFVVEEVKPFIEKTYRAAPDGQKTGVAGSSMGGLISLYMIQVHPEAFGRCGIVSPALGYENRRYLDSLLVGDTHWMQGKRFWLDMGTVEGGPGSSNLLLQHTRDLAAFFDKVQQDNGMAYQYLEVEGGQHNEQAWADRIDAILTYLYGQ